MADYDLPTDALTRCTFVPVFSIGSAAIGNGVKYNVTETVTPFWRVSIETAPMDIRSAAAGQWRAFHSKLRGGINRFLARDLERDKPYAYPSATAPGDIEALWDGTATVTALGASGSLGLSDLPDTYSFLPGDLISLEESGRYHVHEVATAVTAVSGAATVTVTPFLLTTLFSTSAVARIWRPKAAFIIEPDSWQPNATLTTVQFSFTGRQRI